MSEFWIDNILSTLLEMSESNVLGGGANGLGDIFKRDDRG